MFNKIDCLFSSKYRFRWLYESRDMRIVNFPVLKNNRAFQSQNNINIET